MLLEFLTPKFSRPNGRRSLRPRLLSPVDSSVLGRVRTLNTLSILNQLRVRQSLVGSRDRSIRERLQFAATFCGYSLWLLFVATVCGYSLWLHFVTTVCGYSLWLQFVATVCGCSLWLLFPHPWSPKNLGSAIAAYPKPQTLNPKRFGGRGVGAMGHGNEDAQQTASSTRTTSAVTSGCLRPSLPSNLGLKARKSPKD